MVHFDFEKVKAYFDGDLVVLQSFLSLLKKELPRSQQELELQFTQKNLKGVTDAAHKLKGTSVSAGLPELTAMASKMNKIESIDSIQATALLEAIKNEIAVIIPMVEQASTF